MRGIIDDFIAAAREIMEEQLMGIYLHGSLAMGCFNPDKSDIDLIIVIGESITDEQKMKFMQRVAAINRQAPAKGLEMSIVLRKYCSPFVYPTPFELHFSPVHLQWFCDKPQDYVQKMKGEDKDLAAHFMIIRRYGIVLYGEKIENVFAEVPHENYADSIWEDVRDAKEEILQQPIYMILNLCRVLAFLKDGLYLSKKEGAKWAIERLPAEYTAVISSALIFYQTDRDMTVDEESSKAFADQMLAKINNNKEGK